MKASNSFQKLYPSLAMIPLYACSFAALTLALRQIDVGMAYAIWSGVGTAAIAIIGVYWFGEAFGPLKGLSLLFIILGVIGLKMSSTGH